MKIIAFLVFSNIYVALPVVCITLQTAVQFNLDLEPLFLIFIYSATLFSYCFHRVFPFNKKKIGLLSERHIWIDDNKLSFALVAIFAFAVCVGSFVFLKAEVSSFLLPAGVLTLFYTVPFWRIGKNWISLRNIPFLKLMMRLILVSRQVTKVIKFIL